MRVVEREEHEQPFVEGEPDLEAPEELAIGELDDEAMLEEDLDNEDVLEEDVDEDVLEATLEELVHLDDDDDDGSDLDEPGPEQALALEGEQDLADDLELETLDLEDIEESLDRILQERLAAVAAVDEDDEAPVVLVPAVSADGFPIGCRPDEFVCRGCFLVRLRGLLADPAAQLCRDCAS